MEVKTQIFGLGLTPLPTSSPDMKQDVNNTVLVAYVHVHHGGAGTTAAGLRAGCPTTVVPFFGDQFFWGERILARGVGPQPIPISELNVHRLSNAIKFMLEPEVKLRAMELGKQIENEDGVVGAVNAFHRHLPTKLPIPPFPPASEELPHPFQWLLTVIEKWCCLPFTML
ncbi:hypothetical protein KFK09_002341 [Dendrobium nobile]|uniref:Erythromycin biosynthesis protein CIII-like C-terminal domain-containing protein n=1 Tax=Dendrobium nobile TaxID=94219 RepID=A0A8T3C666_DENNO|nr:hypothetical protein KFK09_002341 [Dendrobium nobile]